MIVCRMEQSLLDSGAWTRVRAKLDVPRLCGYLTRCGIRPQAFDPDKVMMLQSNNGMSNPTYYIQQSGSRLPGLIIRKKPAGKLLPGAHQIDREFRAMKHLSGTVVPVPKVHVLCNDATVLGQSFYVMDYVGGPVPNDPGLPGLLPGQRAGVFAHAVQILAGLHNLDYVSLGLEKHGRPGNYADRQLRTWSRQYELGDEQLAKYHAQRKAQIAAAASQLTRIGSVERGGKGVLSSSSPPSSSSTANGACGSGSGDDAKDRLVERVLGAGAEMRLLISRLSSLSKQRSVAASTTSNAGSTPPPDPDETTLVHGDFRMGNFILDLDGGVEGSEGPGRVRAVLDWEISTLGHPLLDLAYLMSPYYSAGEGGFLVDEETGKGGLPEGAPSRDEYLTMYCTARGIPSIPETEWNFWVALNCFRTAAIVHGVFARFIGGNAGSTNASYAGSAFVTEVRKGLRLLPRQESYQQPRTEHRLSKL